MLSIWSWVTYKVVIAQFPLQPLEFGTHAFAQFRIEIAEGLIQQQQIRLLHQCPRQSHALLLSAAQLGRRPFVKTAESDQSSARATLLRMIVELCCPAALNGKGHIVEHVQMGPDRVGLKDHADISVVWYRRRLDCRIEDGLCRAADLAALGPLRAGDTSERRCFATTRWS